MRLLGSSAQSSGPGLLRTALPPHFSQKITVFETAGWHSFVWGFDAPPEFLSNIQIASAGDIGPELPGACGAAARFEGSGTRGVAASVQLHAPSPKSSDYVTVLFQL